MWPVRVSNPGPLALESDAERERERGLCLSIVTEIDKSNTMICMNSVVFVHLFHLFALYVHHGFSNSIRSQITKCDYF